ncbi:glycoside hydrolase family 2 protein, partial [candidate division KSB1 bacterium]|nr:glycoside hydrolase family 2 protein [candidate division KSB1 bacterium]
MSKPSTILIAVLAVVLTLSCDRKQNQEKELSGNWQFKQNSSQTWLPATVPGSVHTDLLAQNKIPDPFFADNEKELQWIGESDWSYQTTFSAKDILQNEHVELVFDGLDTYARVFLNDSLILSADNMFRQWKVEVKNLLKPDDNLLLVAFTAPEKIEQKKAAKLPYQLPEQRGFTRKAPYQYGWDWGPEFITQGLWKPVYLQAWNDVRINDIHVFTKSVSDSTAILEVMADIESNRDQSAEIRFATNNRTYSGNIALKKGSTHFTKEIHIPDPDLWWPNGLGDQPLYNLTFSVKAGGSEVSDTVRFGIRQIELVREKDSIGESFFFRINGVPFFAKGANYIPQDNFPARVTDEKYRQTIQNAVDANMNMLRVWGGGIYEKDIFYDLCDENGILIWQDFMFACNMYPGDAHFFQNVKQEAEYQLKRLRNHPSIALWCGNNEVDEGWHNWGWQKTLGYSDADSTEIWQNYLNLFEDILPNAVSTFAPTTPYTPSSPTIGWGHNEALFEGDMHYWGVWWGAEPFEVYEKKVGRFMSEYGFQGFPDLRTLDSCLLPNDKILDSPALLNHQKHPRGMELIQTYMERDFPVPTSVDDYAYVSQLLQAFGIRMAIEAQRRAMPRCMGSLYWQLNDCWPVISWSSIDYYNRWKALHYAVKNAYNDVLISFEENDDEIAVYVISDQLIDLPVKMQTKLLDFSGNTIREINTDEILTASSSQVYQTFSSKGISKKDQLLVTTIRTADSVVAENLYYFVSPKDLLLPEVEIQKKIQQVSGGYRITLSS